MQHSRWDKRDPDVAVRAGRELQIMSRLRIETDLSPGTIADLAAAGAERISDGENASTVIEDVVAKAIDLADRMRRRRARYTELY